VSFFGRAQTLIQGLPGRVAAVMCGRLCSERASNGHFWAGVSQNDMAIMRWEGSSGTATRVISLRAVSRELWQTNGIVKFDGLRKRSIADSLVPAERSFVSGN
jgi:hypothetical protein